MLQSRDLGMAGEADLTGSGVAASIGGHEPPLAPVGLRTQEQTWETAVGLGNVQASGARSPPWPGVSRLSASLGHALNTQTLTKTDERKPKTLSKFTILCRGEFMATLGHMQRRLDTPDGP